MCKKQKLIITAILLAALVLCIIYCIFPLKTGIADSGSLASVESALGLSKVDNSGFFNYKFSKSDSNGDLGGSLGMWFSLMKALPGSVFDARVSAAFYIILMLISFLLILKNIKILEIQTKV